LCTQPPLGPIPFAPWLTLLALLSIRAMEEIPEAQWQALTSPGLALGRFLQLDAGVQGLETFRQ